MPEKVQKWKNSRRERREWADDWKQRAYPVLNRGSRPCACGRTISANKTQCAACAGVK